MEFSKLKQYILGYLEENLLPNLYYHSPEHIMDVVETAQKIGASEKISEEEMLLLQTAALLHDIGFTRSYENHELIATGITAELLPGWGFSQEQIDKINTMIMATRIPQNPVDRISEILCDADLDYLGREDFEKIGQNLYKELLARNVIQNEDQWNMVQVDFLKSHRYFSEYSRTFRAPVKARHLKNLEKKVADLLP